MNTNGLISGEKYLYESTGEAVHYCGVAEIFELTTGKGWGRTSSIPKEYISKGNNTYQYIDLEHISKIPKKESVKEEFVLPPYWCIKVTEENKKILKKYDIYGFGLEYNYSTDVYYGLNCNKGFGTIHIPNNCIEITFDQFKQYVLKKPMKKENLTNYIPKVGDWIQITKSEKNWASDMDKFVGKVVQIIAISSSNLSVRFEDDGGWNWQYDRGHFKPVGALEKDWTKATKEELLEEAKRRYPKDTVFNSPNGTYEYSLNQKVIISTFKLFNSTTITVCKTSKNTEGIVYENGKWAEIVSKPKTTVEVKSSNPVVKGIELIPGEIYKYSNYIFEYNRYTKNYIVNNQINIKNLSFVKSDLWAFNSQTLKLSIATEEEKQWQKACAKLGKFIPKEEALNMNGTKFEVGKYYQFTWTWNNSTRLCKVTKINARIFFDELYSLDKNNIGWGMIDLKEITNIKELTEQEFNDIINPKIEEVLVQSGLTQQQACDSCKYNNRCADSPNGLKCNPVINGQHYPKDKVKETIPEYVEFIEDHFTHFTKGKIYPLNSKGHCLGDDGTFHEAISYPHDKNILKPSTKEAFDLQNKPKEPLAKAIYCKTQEEWDFVCKEFNSDMNWVIKYPCFISYHNRGDLNWCKKQSYTVISFEDWCKENGYSFGKTIGEQIYDCGKQGDNTLPYRPEESYPGLNPCFEVSLHSTKSNPYLLPIEVKEELPRRITITKQSVSKYTLPIEVNQDLDKPLNPPSNTYHGKTRWLKESYYNPF